MRPNLGSRVPITPKGGLDMKRRYSYIEVLPGRPMPSPWDGTPEGKKAWSLLFFTVYYYEGPAAIHNDALEEVTRLDYERGRRS